MNEIILKGQLKNITYSHTIDNIDYSRATLLCKRSNSNKEDSINIKFKSFSNPHNDGDIIRLKGNLRSFSEKINNDKNKVTLYVFTYFDDPGELNTSDNIVNMTGRICKLNNLRTSKNGKHNIHFIIANNLLYNNDTKRLNSYIPCIAWGTLAKEIEKLSVNTKISVQGELHSREHKKIHENGEVEFRVAHELHIKSFEVID